MQKCLICKKNKAVQQFRPFCSRRCADIDLAKWLGNGYVIPDNPNDEDQHERPDTELLQATGASTPGSGN